MTDTQLIAICLSIMLPLSMLLYSNSRIAGAKETLRAEIGESKQTLRAEIGELRAELRISIERLSNKIDHLAGDCLLYTSRCV